jgi:hypothetical protein
MHCCVAFPPLIFYPYLVYQFGTHMLKREQRVTGIIICHSFLNAQFTSLRILCSPLCPMNRGSEHWRAGCWSHKKGDALNPSTCILRTALSKSPMYKPSALRQNSRLHRNGVQCNRLWPASIQIRHRDEERNWPLVGEMTSTLSASCSFNTLHFM